MNHLHSFTLAALASLAVLITSCTSVEKAAPPVATLKSAKPAGTTKLEHGRDIYVTRCTKCHWAKDIAKRSENEWSEDILPRMVKKAKLGEEDAEAVQAYILAVVHAPRAASS